MPSTYLIRRALLASSDDLRLEDPGWLRAEELELSHFHSRSSDHHPRTRVRILHDEANLFIRFEVDDRYVISRKTQYQEMVCLDSCVEFFFQPKPEMGHFNLEINCGGTFLFYYVDDPRRLPTGLAKFTPVGPEIASQIQILHSMPSVVVPERAEPTRWVIGCRVPFSVLEGFIGPIGKVSQTTWRGNLYKCADHSSHPHWGSWSPLGEVLNFHDREHFGLLAFE
jgi:Carbohydrate-binding family 9